MKDLHSLSLMTAASPPRVWAVMNVSVHQTEAQSIIRPRWIQGVTAIPVESGGFFQEKIVEL